MITSESEQMMRMTENFQQMVDAYFNIQCRYQSAIREVQTKLEILDSEFQMRHSRNPIHSMQSRMKTIQSIVQKLQRRNHEISMESALKNLTDIAGIRVICSYIDDIYIVADLLAQQDDIRILRRRDYIQEPKANGYRSLHLIVEVPVYLSEGKLFVPVEVQLRTIAMDFWATLEHHLRYKQIANVPQSISDQLLEVATSIAELDEKMQHIRGEVDALQEQPPEHRFEQLHMDGVG